MLKMNPLNVFELGITPYKTALLYQKTLLEKRINGDIGDCLILLEHPPTITLGRGGRSENLLINEKALARLGISLEETKRGGDITFHGPGQIVGYPIFDLNGHGRDIHKYLRDLEEVLISALSNFGIEGRRIEKLTGVWVKRSKIASIGIGVRKWTTYHGFALNVNTDLGYFDLIVPCGIRNVRVTSVKEWLNLKEDVEMDSVVDLIKANFMELFDFYGVVSLEESDILL